VNHSKIIQNAYYGLNAFVIHHVYNYIQNIKSFMNARNKALKNSMKVYGYSMVQYYCNGSENMYNQKKKLNWM